MELVVHSLPDSPHSLEAGYDCPCGCKPRVRYQQGGGEAGYEHCCCGRVLFVGPRSDQLLQDYLAQRRVRGLDAELTYTLQGGHLQAPWGEAVAWAQALPDKPRQH